MPNIIILLYNIVQFVVKLIRDMLCAKCSFIVHCYAMINYVFL